MELLNRREHGGRKILTFSTGKKEKKVFVDQRHTHPEAVAEFLKGKSSAKAFLTGCPTVTPCSNPCRSLEVTMSKGTGSDVPPEQDARLTPGLQTQAR